jgi:hypothetical protein
MSNTPTVIITHHTGGTDANPLADSSFATVKDVNEWHKARWPEFVSSLGFHVGYHYFIQKNGKITQTRLHSEEGAHTIGMNTKSIGVCFAGNFDVSKPTKEQMTAWYNLYRDLLKQYPLIPTYPHRKYANKTCHGKLLKDNHFAVYYQNTHLQIVTDQIKSRLINLLTKRRYK